MHKSLTDLLRELLKEILDAIRAYRHRIRSGVITRVHPQRKGKHPMETIKVGETVSYKVVWFDGPNGTGNVITPAAASAWNSSDPANLDVTPTGPQLADAKGIGVETGGIITATDPGTGVSATLSIDVEAVVVPILSGVIMRA